jgi:hypothetical protein
MTTIVRSRSSSTTTVLARSPSLQNSSHAHSTKKRGIVIVTRITIIAIIVGADDVDDTAARYMHHQVHLSRGKVNRSPYRGCERHSSTSPYAIGGVVDDSHPPAACCVTRSPIMQDCELDPDIMLSYQLGIRAWQHIPPSTTKSCKVPFICSILERYLRA